MERLPYQLLTKIISKLRTPEEIANFDRYFQEQNVTHLLADVMTMKNNGLVYQVLCDIFQVSSSSNPGEYARGEGVYQKFLQSCPDTQLWRNANFTYSNVSTALLRIARLLNANYGEPMTYEVDSILSLSEVYSDLSEHPVWRQLQIMMNILHREDELTHRERNRNSYVDNDSESNISYDNSETDISDIYELNESEVNETVQSCMEKIKDKFDSFIDLVARKLKQRLDLKKSKGLGENFIIVNI